MKNHKKFTLLFLFFLSLPAVYSQVIFEYERKIEDTVNYNFENIKFRNDGENIDLEGTLISPKHEFEKIIIIVPGSGQDTRHSHFKLAEEFLKNNIAIFRYDERGIGKSTGNFSNVSYGISQMTKDLLEAVKKIRNIDKFEKKKIGLLGHSQGGMATIESFEKGTAVDFLIQWSTPVEKHGKFLKYQLITGVNTFDDRLFYKDQDTKLHVMNLIHQIIAENKNDDDLIMSKKIRKLMKKEGYKRKDYGWYSAFPTTKDLIRKDFEDVYKQINVPLLYVIGSEDKYVNPSSNIKLLESFNNKLIKVFLLQGLNHYLNTTSLTKMTADVYDISPYASEKIVKWVLSLD